MAVLARALVRSRKASYVNSPCRVPAAMCGLVAKAAGHDTRPNRLPFTCLT